jgi:hypothetical protein
VSLVQVATSLRCSCSPCPPARSPTSSASATPWSASR